MRSCHVFGALAVFALIPVQIHTFNLDLNHPVVYQSKDQGDYFGYSVALHPGGTDAGDLPWMMVGAPKANDSTLVNSRRKDSGLVYKCLVKNGCSRLKLDYSNPPPGAINYWEASMLGSAMDMSTERFVVCGPNWKLKLRNDNTNFRMYGVCYWGMSREVNTEVHSLTPLDTRDGSDTEPIGSVYFPKYMWGQAGFSAALYNNSQGSYELLIGAPSVHNWIGTAISYIDNNDWSSGLAKRRRRSPVTAFTDGPFIPNPRMIRDIGKYGQVGYTVAMGKFFAKTEVVSIAGAPSTLPGGEVFAYTISKKFEGTTFAIKDILTGSQVGEYFGASVAAGDFNGDGLDDLVVGAPHFTSGQYGSQNEGKVYTYTGSSTRKFLTAQTNHEIKGQVSNGRLGTTVACLGDLDLDGYQDFAIAAPYEGSGVVYIYYGSRSGLVLSQSIIGSEIFPQVSRFGFGISRAQDVDKNGYGDIAIGAYKSGHTVLLRSQPVVEIRPSITILGEKLKEETRDFEVEICVSYTGAFAPQKIKVMMKLSIDPGHFRIYRANSPPTLSTTQDTFDVPYPEYCDRLKFVLKSDIKNRLEPIEISGDFSLAVSTSNRSPFFIDGASNRVSGRDEFCSKCPVMKRESIMRTEKIGFYHGCKIEDRCVADLQIETQFLDPINPGPLDKYVVGERNFVLLKVILRNKGDPAFNTKLLVKVQNTLVSLPSTCQDSLNGTEGFVECEAGNPLKSNFDKVFTFELDIQRSVIQQDAALEIQLAVKTATDVVNPRLLTAKPRLPLAYQADVTVYGNPQREDYRFELKSENAEATGKVAPVLIFKMERTGKSPLQEVALKVDIPVAKGSKKFLHLSPPQFSIGSRPLTCQPNEDIVQSASNKPPLKESNPGETGLDGTFSSSSASADASSSSNLVKTRRKRGVSDSPETQVDTNKYPLNRTMFINCKNGDWKCTQLVCSAPLLHAKTPAELEVQLNLDMSLLEGELGQNDIIIFSATAQVVIISPKNTEQPLVQNPDTNFVSAVLLRRAPSGKVASWVIALSVIGGILLLMLLVAGLVKAGFFQRKSRDELLLKKRQTQMAAAGAAMTADDLGENNVVFDDEPVK